MPRWCRESRAAVRARPASSARRGRRARSSRRGLTDRIAREVAISTPRVVADAAREHVAVVRLLEYLPGVNRAAHPRGDLLRERRERRRASRRALVVVEVLRARRALGHPPRRAVDQPDDLQPVLARQPGDVVEFRSTPACRSGPGRSPGSARRLGSTWRPTPPLRGTSLRGRRVEHRDRASRDSRPRRRPRRRAAARGDREGEA